MTLPDGVPASAYCRHCDVFMGFGAAGVVKMPQDRSMDWLACHCWLCGISLEDNAKRNRDA